MARSPPRRPPTPVRLRSFCVSRTIRIRSRRILSKRFAATSRANIGTDQVHEGGLKVYTSLDVELQKAANQAVLDGLAAYERRHGWKGHLENVVAGGRSSREVFASRLGR